MLEAVTKQAGYTAATQASPWATHAPHMAEAHVADELDHVLQLEHVAHQAAVLVQVQPPPLVGRHDACVEAWGGIKGHRRVRGSRFIDYTLDLPTQQGARAPHLLD